MFPSQSITLSLNAVLSLPYLRLAWPLQVKHWVALQAQVSINPAAALEPQESLLTEASIDFRCMHTPPPPPLRSASNSYSTGFTCKNHSQGCRHHLSRTCHSQTCSEIARLCLRCLRNSLNLTWPSQCNPKFLLCFLQPKASSCDFLHSLISLISFLEQTAVKCPVLSEARDRPALHSHPHSLGHLRKGGTREEAGERRTVGSHGAGRGFHETGLDKFSLQGLGEWKGSHVATVAHKRSPSITSAALSPPLQPSCGSL